MIAQHGIAASLPQHEVGGLVDHVSIKARDHLRRLFAPDALVENRHRQPGKLCLQLGLELAWVACRGRACAGTEGRRRTNRYNLDWETLRNALAETNGRM